MPAEAAQRPPSASVAAHAPAVPLRRILGSFWPYTATRRKWMLLALLLSAADPVLMAVEIWLFKVVVDDVLVPRDFAPFPMIAAGYLGLTLLQAVLGAADRMLSTWLTQRFLLDLRSELLRHLQRLPLDFFTRSRLGDLMARLAGDVSAIESFLVSGTNRALRYALELVIFTIALFVLDPTLALVSLVVAPLFWASSRYFSRRIKTISREKQRRSGSINTSIEQTLSTMPLVHAFDAGEREVARYREEAEAKYRAEMASARLRSVYSPTVELIELVGALAVIGVGAWQLSRGALSVGELLAFLTFLSRLYGPVRGLGSTVTAAYSAAAGAERVIELMAEPPMPADRPGAVSLERPRGEVRVERVGYRYADQAVPALDDVSFTLRPGEVIAVVGASGAGKTTLARLILRGARPRHRSGAPRRPRPPRRDPRLAATPRRGRPPGDAAGRRNRPRQHHLRTPRRDRRAGPRGCHGGGRGRVRRPRCPTGTTPGSANAARRLSGGQAQRIAIARAMLCDAPVLLLDEPTASLDAHSSDRVLAPLRRLMAGRATLVISHNLLTAELADRVLVLDRGRLVQEGSHEELVARPGPYAALWEMARGAGVAR